MMANNRIPSGPNTPGSQQTPTTQQGIKIFIQRDYSEGTAVKFQTRFPPELEDRVSESRLFTRCCEPCVMGAFVGFSSRLSVLYV